MEFKEILLKPAEKKQKKQKYSSLMLVMKSRNLNI